MLSGRTILDDRREPVELQRRPPLVMPWNVGLLMRMPKVGLLLKAVLWSLLLLGMVAAIVLSDDDAASDVLLPFGIVSAMVLGSWVLVFVILQRRDVAYRARQLAMETVCPACGYNLEGVSPDNAGFSQCSECGAAWHLETAATSAAAKRPPTVVDDRGVRHDMHRHPPQAAPQPWSWRDYSRMPLAYCVFVLLLTLAFFGFIGLYAWHRLEEDPGNWAVFAEAVIWLSCYALLTSVFGPIFNTPRFPPGCCRCCGCVIRKTPKDDEGMTTCPTCSAAWKL